MKNKYYIADFNSRQSGGYQQLAPDATKDNMWVTLVPPNPVEEIREPKLFETRADAMEWKDRLQAQANEDWQENSHIYKAYGQARPAFKIYKYGGNSDE